MVIAEGFLGILVALNDILCQSILLYLFSGVKDTIPETKKTCQDKHLDVKTLQEIVAMSPFNVKGNSTDMADHPASNIQ